MVTIYPHKKQKIGWYPTTTGNDPITTGTGYHKFGLLVRPWGEFPNPKFNINQIFDGSSRDVSDMYVNQKSIEGTIGFAPTNGIPMYQFLGQSTTTSNEHAVTGINSGNTPEYVVRYQTSNNDASTPDNYLYRSIIGCRTKAIAYTFNFNQPNVGAFCGVTFDGLDDITPTNAPTDNITPGFLSPGKLIPYRKDSNFVFTYGGTSLVGEIRNIVFRGAMQNIVEGDISDIIPGYILSGYRTYAIGMTLLYGSSTTDVLESDYLDQNEESTFSKTLSITIANGVYNFGGGDVPTYMKFNWKNIGIADIQKKNANFKAGEESLMNVTMLCKSTDFFSKDVVANSEYGE